MKKQLFYERMKMLLDNEFDEFIKALETNLNKGIRLNSLKINRENFKKIIPFELEDVAWCNEGFFLENMQERPSKHPYYYAGLYYLQEPSAMIPVEALDIKPGDKVLDISAAPGGKSTQIAAKLNGEGILVSNDINPKRTIALNKNISIFGVKNSVVTNQRPDTLANIFPRYFNKVLVDAPCSGEGLIKKDIKNFEDDHEKYVNMQKQILTSVHEMIADGGEMVYSTCTFNPQENEGIIKWFINTFKEYEVIDINIDNLDHGRPEWIDGDNSIQKVRRAWPHKIRGEGHFIAKLKKMQNNKVTNFNKFKKNNIRLDKYYDFVEEFLANDVYQKNVHNINDNIFLIPEELVDLKNIKTMSLGLRLGEIKGNKFIPSQELAMTLNKNNFSNIIDLSSEDMRVIKYLKGETIEIENCNKGLNLVCVDGFGLGFGKANDGMLKNLYRKQWRML
ncbi:RsmB/NOP family class I SAM-dependent RNA methyltransferase [Sedimentibacter sp. zth1]|uniref:RsmF rRNA methyltransferase first C-terminal domain-containing protein n=1 Tax=Sedimentibacter sp. zth1 TaxID=2816908 RepID=UPI001A910BFC|nr:RsmB/NOP family class I SAM-dependent RNA methyltransferase [Sedimentibacter sp. zth1]QSX07041.1 RsmB/NOP family class I SAM-dependent RNA methyltransferase [Sedimentibacter sp. zth1]